ncbi:MAG: HAMP domain-containing histidine kinase [Spirochaetales bacterium]|nr:HAMP domain-containing histidine kinase [Spirochaetales bacterium]
MNNGKRKIKILMAATGVILLTAVILMGVFQIKAVIKSGLFTEESLRRNLSISLYHTGQELFTNERQLLSMLYPLRLERYGSDPQVITGIFDNWYAGMTGANHIKGVYFKSVASEKQVFRYFPDDDFPVEVAAVPQGLLMIPLRALGKGQEIFIDVDKENLFGNMLPEVLDSLGSEYAWRIKRNRGDIVYEKGMEGIDYRYELKIGLGDRFLFSFNDLRGIQSLFGKDRELDDKPVDDVFSDLEEDWGTLEIFFAQGPLNQIVRRQISLNLGASLVAIILIIGGYLILFRLYQRSEEQRQEEQEFVATISHELRTPLAVLSSAGENISRGIIKGERLGDYGRMITRESKRLEEMIEGVLYYSGLQKGSSKVLIQEEIDLEVVLDEIRQRYLMKSREMDVKMVFNIQADLPLIKTGRQAFSIVAGNLINNGLLHAYPPGHPVKPEERIVSIRLNLVDKMVVLEVEDRGCGIPLKEQKRVFKAFMRGERSRRSQIPGSGLGLNIAKRVAEISGGELDLISHPVGSSGNTEIKGVGTLFRFSLPVEIFKDANDE